MGLFLFLLVPLAASAGAAGGTLPPPDNDAPILKPRSAEVLAFERMDRDGDRIVTRDELRSEFAMRLHRSQLQPARKREKIHASVTGYLRIYDADRSGDVSLEEVIAGRRIGDKLLGLDRSTRGRAI